MPTANFLQSLNTASDGATTGTSSRSQVETFIAKETVFVGAWVAFDYAATSAADATLGVYLADGNSTPVRTPFGVVVSSAETSGTLTAGSKINVCVAGVASGWIKDAGGAGRAVGTLLQITNDAGKADIASAASAQPVCGIVAETVGAGGDQAYRVIVIKQF